MESRIIPHTSLEVSPLCLGTMTFGTPVEEKEGISIVHWALDHGVNFVDTANIYQGYTRYIGSAGGVAETIIGKALEDRREQAVVATKVGMMIGPGPDDGGLSRAHILRECHRSLERLATDWIDIYYMHTPDPDTPIEESVATFVELIAAGEVRYWGLSNFAVGQVLQVLQTCDAQGWPRPVVHQPPYSLLKRDIEQDLLPLCREEHIAVVPYQVLQGGLLTGKYTDPSAPPAGTRGAEKPEWVPMLQDETVSQELGQLRIHAQEQGLGLFDYVLRTTLETPGIASIILGVKRSEQLEEAIEALE
jgi:aryl-alcohol dehydrogenase-like predicted oxidoreductase